MVKIRLMLERNFLEMLELETRFCKKYTFGVFDYLLYFHIFGFFVCQNVCVRQCCRYLFYTKTMKGCNLHGEWCDSGILRDFKIVK